MLARRAPLSSQFRIGDIAKSISDEVKGEDRGEDGEAGKDGEPGSIGELVQAVSDHGSPAGSWGADAQADKAEARFHDDGGCDP